MMRLSIILALCSLAGPAMTWGNEPVPVPPDAQAKENDARIRQLFANELAQANDAEKKAALARRVMSTAKATTGDPAAHYSLLRLARDLAVEGRDTEFALGIVDAIVSTFDVDEWSLQLETLMSLSRRADDRLASRVDDLNQLIARAIVEEEYETADALSNIAVVAGRQSGDSTVPGRQSLVARDARSLAVQHRIVLRAWSSLEADPTRPDANLTVGKWKCFVRGEWTTGLPLLAKGSDPRLRSIADADLASAEQWKPCMELGDGWAAVARSETGWSACNVWRRARHWYTQALPQTSGLDGLEVRKRLDDAKQAIEAHWASGLLSDESAAADQTVQLSVREPWPFALPVKAGQKLHITAEGFWRVLPGGRKRGPNGSSFFLHGRLDSGEPFKVGSDFTLHVEQDAVLYLGMREGGTYSNNSGSIKVTIKTE